MSVSTFLARARKALAMPPAKLAARLADGARHQARRPWASIYPRVLRDATLIGDSGARSLNELWTRQLSQPFFLRPADLQEYRDAFETRYPGEAARVIALAEQAIRHEFDLLGSGARQLGPQLPWLDDFKTGRHYPLQYCRDIQYMELDKPTDVKVPWELSRCQHFTALGQAYWLTGDERYAAEYRAEIEDWIANNPFAYSVNWACAMDVALRAINWIWGFYFMGGSKACADPAFRRVMLRSLFAHGEFVRMHLERGSVNGNHYLSDAAGLVFLGLFFKHTDAGRRWLDEGRRIAFEEMLLQVSSDGVDFEQSTSYQRLVLELFLTIYLLLERHGDAVPADAMARLARMTEYVAAYTKPNGLAPLFGDADDGRVQKLGQQGINDHRYLLSTGAVRFGRPDFKTAASRFWEESFWLLGPKAGHAFDALPEAGSPVSRAFSEGGMYVMRNPVVHAVVDFAEVGMRGRGGHGHNDISSFELFFDGANLVSDCGAYLYTASREWRNRFRSTSFHNVAQVGDEELNRFVGPDALWQLHDDARPVDVRWDSGGSGGYLSGGHTGYARFRSPVSSTREFFVDPVRPLVIIRDYLSGSTELPITWRFHFDPAVVAEIVGVDCRLQAGDHEAWLLAVAGDIRERRLEPGWVSPSYGVRAPTTVLVVTSREWPAAFTSIFADVRLTPSERDRAVALLDSARTNQ